MLNKKIITNDNYVYTFFIQLESVESMNIHFKRMFYT